MIVVKEVEMMVVVEVEMFLSWLRITMVTLLKTKLSPLVTANSSSKSVHLALSTSSL